MRLFEKLIFRKFYVGDLKDTVDRKYILRRKIYYFLLNDRLQNNNKNL